jgi:mRNA-degrading endonuclease toxin of MazEF toxin-antitoxin module
MVPRSWQRVKPRRWELWEIDLDPGKGREQGGIRPCLVISIDALNQSNFGTIIVCPITTAERPSFRWRVPVLPVHLTNVATDWKPRPHWVETDQLATIDLELGGRRRLATLQDRRRRLLVEDSVRMMLGL